MGSSIIPRILILRCDAIAEPRRRGCGSLKIGAGPRRRGRVTSPAWAHAMLELILQTSVNALVASSFTALVAVGLVLIFGVMGIVNFAHGELYMVGAFAVWYLSSALGWPFLLAVAAAIVIVAAIGAAMERLLFKPMRTNPLGGLIMSVGTLFILQVAALEFGGGTGRAKHVTPP